MDLCGNSAQASQTITVEDNTAPVITSDKESQIVCEVLPAPPVFTWTDLCSGTGTATVTGVSERIGCVTKVTYTYSASDGCGNSATKTVVYTLETNVTTGCETAFGKAESGSSCFLTEDKPYGPFNRWGWTNNISPETESVIPLYAGNSQCDAIPAKKVGEAIVKYAGNTVTVTYKLINNGNDPGKDYLLSEAHVYVGCEKYPKNGKKYTVAPGQFTFNKSGLDKTTGLTVTFTNVHGPVWIIVHAVTCEEVCRCSSNIYHDNFIGGTMSLSLACTATINSVYVEPKKKGAEITTNVEVLELNALKVYPNPFNDKVNFEFTSGKDTHAVLEITNVLGQKISTLLDGPVKVGVQNRIEYTPKNVAPGILIFRLIMDGEVQNGRVIYRK